MRVARKRGPKLPPDEVLALAFSVFNDHTIPYREMPEALRVRNRGRHILPEKLHPTTVLRYAKRFEEKGLKLDTFRVFLQGVEEDEFGAQA